VRTTAWFWSNRLGFVGRSVGGAIAGLRFRRRGVSSLGLWSRRVSLSVWSRDGSLCFGGVRDLSGRSFDGLGLNSVGLNCVRSGLNRSFFGERLAVQQLPLDLNLRTGATALTHASALADAITQVVELGAPDVTASGNLNLLDLRRVQRERALDANAKRLLADRKGLARTVALALDDDALKDLGTATSAFDHLEVDTQAVTSVELRDSAELCSLQGFNDGAHGSFLSLPVAPA